MRNRIFFGLLVCLVLFLACFSSSLAYYNFLSPEGNIYLEELKEKFREKEIVLKKEEGMIWTVITPKNSGVETRQAVKEAVYSEDGKFEAVYTFTDIIIRNPQSWTRVVWGFASKFHPYDIPRLHFVFDS